MKNLLVILSKRILVSVCKIFSYYTVKVLDLLETLPFEKFICQMIKNFAK